MLWSASICLLAVLLSLFILNTVAGLLVFYFDSSQSIFWHSLSIYIIGLLLLVMSYSVVYELYVFRSGGHSLAKQLRARRLSLIESTPEESIALKITEKLADTFLIETPAVYVLPDEVGAVSYTHLRAHET